MKSKRFLATLSTSSSVRPASARSKVALLLTALGAAALSGASEIPFAANAGITSGFNGAAAIIFADVDGDGDLDAVGAAAGTVRWFENTAGNGSVWTPHDIDTTLSAPAALAIGDFNNDGALDIAVADHGANKAVWYANSGSGGFGSANAVFSAASSAPSAIAAGDFDGDGDLDIAGALEGADQIVWWANNGSGGGWAQTTVDNAIGEPSSLAVGDIDRDGDWDIAATSPIDGNVRWYENGGAGTFTGHTINGAALDGARHVFIADMNFDGFPDVGAVGTAANTLAWWGNDGSPGNDADWESGRRTVSSSAAGASFVAAADLDSDGDIDLVTASAGGNAVVWWENTNRVGSAWTARNIETAYSGPSALALNDLDGDGDIDIAMASVGESSLNWRKNLTIHRNAVFAPEQVLVDSLTGASDVAVADVDGDGIPDIVGAASGANSISWWDLGGGLGQTVDSSFGGASAIVLADIDGNGTLDIVGAASTDNQVSWWSNAAGNGVFGAEQPIHNAGTHPFTGAAAVAVADLDGDGHLDILGAASGGGGLITWWENSSASGDGSSWAQHPVSTAFTGATAIAPGDINRDGAVDMVAGGSGGVAWWESDGAPQSDPGDGSSWTQRTIEGGSFPNVSRVALADIDRDAALDVAAVNSAGAVAWWANNGTGQSWTKTTVASGETGARGLALADLDRDGDVDMLVAAETTSDLIWFENADGAGGAWVRHVISDNVGGARAVFAADLDFDGDLDLAAAGGSANEIRVWANQGGQFGFTTADIANAILGEGETGGALRIDALHLGRAGDTDIELKTLELLLESANGAPLSQTDAQELISNLYILRDDGDGVLELLDDTLALIFATEEILPVNGVITIPFDDGDENVRVPHGAPVTFFLAVEFTNVASGVSPNTLQITHLTESSSAADDRDHDIPLELAFTPNVTSTNITAEERVEPQVASASAVDSTHVDVVFNEVMTDNAALVNPVNYSVNNALSVVSVARISATVARLQTSEMKDGQSYTVTVSTAGPSDLVGNTVDPAANTANFTGIGQKPQVVSATPQTDGFGVLVAFNEAMANNATLTNAANYGFGGLLLVDDVAAVSSTSVMVILATEMVDGFPYTLTVDTASLTDLAGNTVDPGANTADFTGIGVMPEVVSAQAQADGQSVIITFSEDMNDDEDFVKPSTYAFTAGLTPNSVSVMTLSTVRVTFASEMTAGTEYTVTVNANLVFDRAGNPLNPAKNSATFTGIADAPQVAGAAALDARTVAVTFSEPMTHNAALTNPGSYSFTNGLSPSSVSIAGGKIVGTVVHVTVNEMRQSLAYQVTVTGPIDEHGQGMDPAANSASFAGIGELPQVTGAEVINDTTVRITFSEAMRDDADLRNPTFYTFTGGDVTLTAANVAPSGATRVNVTVADMLDGASYTAQVATASPTDLAGNPIDPAANTADFTGVRMGVGETFYVDAAFSGTSDGSISAPYPTIAEAVDATVAGRNDTIRVRPGEYFTPVTLKRNTTLLGEEGAYHTLVLGDHAPQTLLTLAHKCIVRGLTLAEAGAGAKAGNAAGIYVPDGAAVTVTNCVLANNDIGLHVASGASAASINNTFYENAAFGMRGEPGAVFSAAQNNIVAANEVGISGDSGALLIKGYTCFHDNGADILGVLAAPTDFAADPQFIDPENFNFHLKNTSPCRNGGDPDSSFNDRDDSRNDNGADGGPHGAEDSLAPTPHIATAPDPATGHTPLEVFFDGSGSNDEWGIASYVWDFDATDGLSEDAAGATASHNYTSPGTFTATLRVTDHSGLSAQTTALIVAGLPEELPTVSASATPNAGIAPLEVQFQALGEDPDGGVVTYSWDFNGDGLSDSVAQNPVFTYLAGTSPGAYVARVTVIDDEGATAHAVVPITVTEEPPLASLEIDPAIGGQFVVDDPGGSFDGLSVIVPPGAISEPIVLTISPVPAPPALTPRFFGVMAHLGPPGMAFSQPVTVSMPHPADTPHPGILEVRYYDTATGRWRNNGITNVQHIGGSPSHQVSFNASHFTIFAVTPVIRVEDVNLTGEVNAVDVQLTILGALDVDVAPYFVDVTGDGLVTSVDVQKVILAALE